MDRWLHSVDWIYFEGGSKHRASTQRIDDFALYQIDPPVSVWFTQVVLLGQQSYRSLGWCHVCPSGCSQGYPGRPSLACEDLFQPAETWFSPLLYDPIWFALLGELAYRHQTPKCQKIKSQHGQEWDGGIVILGPPLPLRLFVQHPWELQEPQTDSVKTHLC
jgi:hypothetical protein